MSFRFKKFFVDDSRCGLKVGTDGVLLGSWSPIPEVATDDSCKCLRSLQILDVGTGSGLIALMLAQRTENAMIKAIDIDTEATLQAADNFADSPWSNRLKAECISLQQFALENNALFDLIVSNPPFFTNSVKAPNKARSMARHTDTLPLEDLVKLSAQLLTNNGLFSVVLPADEEANILCFASNNSLYLTQRLRVRGRTEKPIKRVLLCFQKQAEQKTIIRDVLVAEDILTLEEQPNKRTAEYTRLMQDFYL